ncbi:MAG: HEAT repeat domain-containing protein, partial [Planctomycetota bacterium]|nr:HEAT repeat domain-containing protein [Planctomycetota bacterium]
KAESVKPAAPKAAKAKPTAPKSEAPASTKPDPVPGLLRNLQSDNVRIAASAARSLGVVFSPSEKPRDDRPAIIAKLSEKLGSRKGGDLRRESAVALGRIRATEAVDQLKETLNDEDVGVAIAAGNAIAQTLAVDEARVYLKAQGESESENVRTAVLDAMASIAKPEDTPFLMQGVSVNNWRAQQAAVRGLERTVRAGARLQPEDYDKIATVLGNEITNASNQAVHFFTHIRNEESLAAVLKAADTLGDGTKEDKSWRTRTFALRTIRHIGWPANKNALPVVIRNLGDRTTNVTSEARNIIHSLRKDYQMSQNDLFPLMLAELEKAEPLRLRAGIMQEMGTHVERQFASRVAKVASETLTKSLEEPKEWQARTSAIMLLGASGHTGSIEDIAGTVADNVTNVRQAAGRALEQLSPLCTPEERAKVHPILQPLVEKPVDWRKTAIAARAMGYFPSETAIEPLIRLLSHSVLNVRDGAENALSRLVKSEDDWKSKIEKPLHAELGKTEAAWEYGAKVLGSINDKKAIPLLSPILQSGNWRAQVNAANAVATIAGEVKVEDPDLNAALVRASQSEVVQVQDAVDRALRAVAKAK